MPDAGEFNRSRSQSPLPRDWGSAFAAMPLETPDANGWHRLHARLPAAAPTARHTPRWPLWLATAASLALAVAIPLRMQQDSVGIAATEPAAPLPAASLRVAPVASRVGDARSDRAVTAPGTMAAAAPDTAAVPRTQVATRRGTPVRRAGNVPARQPIRTLAKPAEETRIAAADSIADLESLYVQSAQLEGLLVLARDDRVSSGPVAALTEGLDAQIASIDAALIQPGLPSQRRTELWGERVDTLRQLVGVEATQRLLAARGQQYDAALVSID